MPQPIDHLIEDAPIAGQKFFLKSTIRGPDGTLYEKLRCVCGTVEEARRTAASLMQQDDRFNIALGEVGKWSPSEATPDNCDNTVYQDEKLQAMMSQYLENQRAAKDEFHRRKAAVMQDGLLANLKPDEVIPSGQPGPPPPMDERALRELAVGTVHPAERAAMLLPELEDTTIDLPQARSNAWKACV